MNTFGPAFFTGIHAAAIAKVASIRSDGINKFNSEDALEFSIPAYGSSVGDISVSASSAVLESIALNPNTPASILRRLSEHCQPEVRAALAENLNTPIETIYKLVADEDPDVRFQLAENHQLPIEVLHLLCKDDNPYVSCRALRTVERIQHTKDAVREGWTSFRRAQSLRQAERLDNGVGTTTVTTLRKVFANLCNYARAT